MLKRRWVAAGMVVVILASLMGCVTVEGVMNQDKTIAGNSAQKRANEVKTSQVPDFEKLYSNTVEIHVRYGQPDGTEGTNATKIKDGRIISDILKMIGESKTLTDESKIKDMSGVARKNNHIELITQNGEKTDILFVYDDPAFMRGYMELGGKKYDPGYDFFRYMADFAEYDRFDTQLEPQVEALFDRYSWTVDYRVAAMEETLPQNFKHDAGEFPVKLYWAYNNVLSKNIGLDFQGYLGKKVGVEIYRLREPLPEKMHPRMDARGIVLKYEGKIIGAFIDAGRHNCFACALDGKSLEDITEKGWDSWIADYINYDNALEVELSKMKPEEVIKKYFDAMNNHDQNVQYACLTRQNLCTYLSSNMNNGKLINRAYEHVFMDGSGNVTEATFIEAHEMSVSDNPSGTVEYSVTVDFKFKKEITSSSGKQTRFVILKKESEKSGWRISSIGTGP